MENNFLTPRFAGANLTKILNRKSENDKVQTKTNNNNYYNEEEKEKDKKIIEKTRIKISVFECCIQNAFYLYKNKNIKKDLIIISGEGFRFID